MIRERKKEFALVGRCGLYCGSCIIYRASKDSAQLRKKVAKRENCRPEEVRCDGCQTVSTKGWNKDGTWGRNCRIVRCLDAKGLDFCYECDTYPNCEEFQVIAEISLKHGESLTENLKRIKAGETKEWLEEEAEKWSCHICRKPISRHLKECHWCRAKLEKSQVS